MNHFLKYIGLFVIIFLLGFNSLFAGEFSGEISLKEVKVDSLTLDWEEVEGAFGYYIYYGTKSGIESGYDLEYDDLVETTQATLDNLETTTTYYIGISAIDENGDELAKSEEVSFITGGGKKLLLEGVKVVGKSDIELSFASNIDEKKEKDFILTKISDTNEITISSSEVFGKSVVLNTENELVTGEKYQVVIISLYGIDGTTITSGIDGSVRFTAPDLSQFDEVNEIADEGGKNENDGQDSGVADIEGADKENTTEEPELTSGADIDPNKGELKESDGNLAGQDVSDEELEKNINVAAGNTQNLPSTGPEHIFLLFLALLLGILIFGIKTKKIK